MVLATSSAGVGIDVALGALPFEERAVARASDWRIDENVVLHTCSAEDLAVCKAFAGRTQDWVDNEMIVVRQGNDLDAELILQEVSPLLEIKEAPEDRDRLRSLLER